MRDNDFFSWRRDMLYQLQSAAAGEEVYNLLQRETEALEYDYYTLCIRHPIPFIRPRVIFQSTYPRTWMSHYQAENYFAIDPVLCPKNSTRDHLPWESGLPHGVAALWDGARDHGLKRGVTQCLTLPNHTQGSLSVSANNRLLGSYPDDKLEIRPRMLTELGLLAFLRLRDKTVMPPEMRFNRHELEILKQTAGGKASTEVVMILSTSENTVSLHQKGIQRKLNAPNKTQVVCYAVTTGLI